MNFISVFVFLAFAVAVNTLSDNSFLNVVPQRCLQPIPPSRCRMAIRQYWFDYRKGECRQYIYGGCNLGVNSFDTMEDCNFFCGSYAVLKNPGLIFI